MEASMMALINQTNPRFVLMVTGIIEKDIPKCTDYFYKEREDIPAGRFRFYRLSNDFDGEAVGFEGQKVIKEGSIIEYGGKYERTDDYFVGVDIFNEAKIVPGLEGSVEPFSFGEPSGWVGDEIL